jgi:D-alanyl-D-alanine carboxypeptidase (penicillin-binding protein 5/6)
MNRTAIEVGMTHTRFPSPVGDSDGDAPTTTARDLANLAWTVTNDDAFRKLANTRRYAFDVAGRKSPGNGANAASATDSIRAPRTVTVSASNRLLEIEGFDGVKAAGDERSGACLVASGRRGDDRLIVVVLGATSSEGRYVDARNLFRWAWLERGHK